MNRFDKREQKIIAMLADSKLPLTGKVLCMSLGMSLRTIQSAVSSINRKLPLICSSNKGYLLDREIYATLQKGIVENKNDEYAIFRRLLLFNGPFQIDELAEEFYMSTSSLEKKLKNFSVLLEQFHLQIQRKHAYIQITGDELNKRKIINHLIYKEITPAFNSINNLADYFPNTDIEKINSIVLNSINKFGYFTETTYYNNLVINIVIALYRMRSDHYVMNSVTGSIASESTEYKIAHEICLQYASHCHIVPSENDISYIATLLEGQIKPIHSSEALSGHSGILKPEFVSALDEMLKEVFDYYMLNIDYSDSLYGFALHINEMIKRAQNTQPATNEILENIKKNCPFIHDVSVSLAQKISKKYNIEIIDSEIGYISIHIGYLIEAATQLSDKISVLLLCDDYHHISETIKAKINQHFSEFINLVSLDVSKTDSLAEINADLIITTRPLNIFNQYVLVVSPFYTAQDHINVTNAVHECLETKRRAHNSSLLSSFFHEKLFFRNNDFSSKEDVIRFLGEKIIDFGLADSGFTESVLKREQLSSTCFFDSFAIPHAMEMNARKTMVCVLISSKGISWDQHKIHIVLMITVHQQDRKAFMELYNGIVRTLENPEKLQRLIASNNYTEFIQGLIKMNPSF